jgi:hypothetical protein
MLAVGFPPWRETATAQNFRRCLQIRRGVGDGAVEFFASEFERRRIVGEVNQSGNDRSDFGKKLAHRHRIEDPASRC